MPFAITPRSVRELFHKFLSRYFDSFEGVVTEKNHILYLRDLNETLSGLIDRDTKNVSTNDFCTIKLLARLAITQERVAVTPGERKRLEKHAGRDAPVSALVRSICNNLALTLPPDVETIIHSTLPTYKFKILDTTDEGPLMSYLLLDEFGNVWRTVRPFALNIYETFSVPRTGNVFEFQTRRIRNSLVAAGCLAVEVDRFIHCPTELDVEWKRVSAPLVRVKQLKPCEDGDLVYRRYDSEGRAIEQHEDPAVVAQELREAGL